jgi:dolichyl-diphosphooligosaccharide--protein glycosyltransferase
MNIRKMFRRLKITDALKSLRALRFTVSHSSLLHFSTLILILFIAFMVRLLPIRWGFDLSEFDPHTQYRLTKYMVNNGFFSWVSWHDQMSWYPNGFDYRWNFPGLAANAAFFYIIARTLGLSPAPMFTANPLNTDPIFNFCVLFPVIMGTLTCLIIYFLGRDIGGKEVGLFSALFLALNASYIGRTSLGFFDDETIGIFGLLLFILFFLRSIDPERSLRNSLTYTVAAGLSLGYLFAGWGAARYPVGMTVIFVFVLLLLRRYSTRLFLSYSATFGIAIFIAINVPKLGFGYLTETTILAALGIFLLLCIYEASRYLKSLSMKTVFVFCSFAISAVFFLMLLGFGYIGLPGFKFMSVLNPAERFGSGTVQQLVQSVQEQRPAAWGSFYYDLGIGALFVPVGLFFAVQNPTNRNIFLCIFGLTSVYFASSMVRLTLLMAPAMSLLWALALVRLLGPFITIIKETPVIQRRRMRPEAHVGKEFSGAFILMTFLLLTFTLVLPSASPGAMFPRDLDHAYSPTTIDAASLPLRPTQPVPDWLNALNWMRVNLQSTDVVAAWWDYGYWITTIANKTTIADNGTSNSTQIALIGLMFMSNETEAIKILDRLGATYVVVFVTFRLNTTGAIIDQGWGDEGKWRWMAKIAGGTYGFSDTDFVEKDPQTGEPNWSQWNARGQNTVIYKLMKYGEQITVQNSSTIQLEHFEKAYFSRPPSGYMDPLKTFGVVPLVCVYKINYD